MQTRKQRRIVLRPASLVMPLLLRKRRRQAYTPVGSSFLLFAPPSHNLYTLEGESTPSFENMALGFANESQAPAASDTTEAESKLSSHISYQILT